MTAATTRRSLPGITDLRTKSQAFAAVDAVLTAPSIRYHSFDRHFRPAQQLASADDGGGNNYHILFCQEGAVIRGFDHESGMSPWSRDDLSLWPGIKEGVPQQFRHFLEEESLASDGVHSITFCLWQYANDPRWHAPDIAYPDNDPEADGSSGMLWPLAGNIDSYIEFLTSYYGREFDHKTIQSIWQHAPMTREMVSSLAPKSPPVNLRAELDKIGYPIADGV